MGHNVFCKFLMILSLAIVFNGCKKKENKLATDSVAQIGEHLITKREFQLNYEFGFAHLKKGQNRKLAYLENMISEKLLSLEGYRLGLNKTERVQNLEKQLMEELLVEELFFKEVNEKIKISPREIKEAISKSNVSFKLRYWIEPNLKEAEAVNSLIREKGFTEVVQEIIEINNEVNRGSDNFETDYLSWLDIPQELFKDIKDLEVGEISKLILFEEVYLTLQIVDIKKGILSDWDYKNTYKRVEQILFSRKLKQETRRYVTQFMEPKNVVTKATTFNILARALAEWKMDSLSGNNFQKDIEQAGDTKPALQKLKDNLETTLINFEKGHWTLEDFIAHFDPASVKTDPSDKGRFKGDLNHQIAMRIGNWFLAEEALAKGLEKSTKIENELDAWRDKWVYEEMRQQLTADIQISEKTVHEYFDDNLARYKTSNKAQPEFKDYKDNARQDAYIENRQLILNKKVQALKNEYPVRINRISLDSISVIDFEKSRWANLLLYKSGSGRQAVPVADPAWSF